MATHDLHFEHLQDINTKLLISLEQSNRLCKPIGWMASEIGYLKIESKWGEMETGEPLNLESHLQSLVETFFFSNS